MAGTIAVAHFLLNSEHAVGVGVFTGSCVVCVLSVRTVWKLTDGLNPPELDITSPRLWTVAAASIVLGCVSLVIRAWIAHALGAALFVGFVLIGLPG